MKRIILITSLVISLIGLTAFGQGYFVFQTGKSQVWDGFTTGVPHPGPTVNVAFLWAANGSVPMVDSLSVSTPPSNTPAAGPTEHRSLNVSSAR